MIELNVTSRTGETHHITAAGGTLMQAIADGGIDDNFGICGGACACASCHVLVDDHFVSVTGAAGEVESELLESSEFKSPTSRLACQISLTAALQGLRVTIAPEG